MAIAAPAKFHSVSLPECETGSVVLNVGRCAGSSVMGLVVRSADA